MVNVTTISESNTEERSSEANNKEMDEGKD